MIENRFPEMDALNNLIVYTQPDLTISEASGIFGKYGEIVSAAETKATYLENLKYVLSRNIAFLIVFCSVAVTKILGNLFVQSTQNRKTFTVYYLLVKQSAAYI